MRGRPELGCARFGGSSQYRLKGRTRASRFPAPRKHRPVPLACVSSWVSRPNRSLLSTARPSIRSTPWEGKTRLATFKGDRIFIRLFRQCKLVAERRVQATCQLVRNSARNLSVLNLPVDGEAPLASEQRVGLRKVAAAEEAAAGGEARGVRALENVMFVGADHALLLLQWASRIGVGAEGLVGHMCLAVSSMPDRLRGMTSPCPRPTCANRPHSRNTSPLWCLASLEMAASVNCSHPCSSSSSVGGQGGRQCRTGESAGVGDQPPAGGAVWPPAVCVTQRGPAALGRASIEHAAPVPTSHHTHPRNPNRPPSWRATPPCAPAP